MPVKTVFAPHLNRHVRFGRRRPVSPPLALRLSTYLRASLPPAPAVVDYAPAALGVLRDVMANDELGDCVVAGGYHVAGVATSNAGAPFHATRDQVIRDYSAIGGYVPGNESTDNGCQLATALRYWQTHGFANGTKLLGWLAIDATNRAEVASAMWLFENLYFGIDLPDAWISPFPSADGFVWGPGQPDPENGHCICGVGCNANGVQIDTWGLLGTVTWPAVAQLAASSASGELYVMLTPDQLGKGQAKAPNGVSWVDLVRDFDSIGGAVPVPAPAPPPPAPAPSAPPTYAQASAAVSSAMRALHPLVTRQQAEAAALHALAPLWPPSS